MSDSLQTEKILGQIDVSIEKFVNGKIRNVDHKVDKVNTKVDDFHDEFIQGHKELMNRLTQQDEATLELRELMAGANTFFRVSLKGAKYISVIAGAVLACLAIIKVILHK